MVVSSYNTIHDVLTVQGAAFSDRPNYFRLKYTIPDMVGTKSNDASWRKLRKLSHSYLKQFGDGMSQLEDSLHGAVERMIVDLEATNSCPVNVMDILKDATFRSISVLLFGRILDNHNSLLKMVMKYERVGLRCFEPLRVDMVMLDNFPWLIHFPLPTSNELKSFVKLQDDVWNLIKTDQKQSDYASLTKLLLKYVSDDTSGPADNKDCQLTDEEAGQTCFNLIMAGMVTTSIAMYCIINSLAYRQDIQERILTEIITVCTASNSRTISLAQRSMMPYLRATILETLRYFTVTPLGAAIHVAREDTELKGYGAIPKGTAFIINTWSLHHDKAFWGDPENFRPERFLDEDGELLAADHPN